MQITTQLAGRKVREVWRNGTTLLIRCEDGHELQIGWVDQNGKSVDGQPVIVFAGQRIIARPVEMERKAS